MSNAKIKTVVILNGQTTSPWVNNDREGGEATHVLLYTKAGVSGTFTLEVTYEHGTPAESFTLQIGGSDAAPPAAGKAKMVEELAKCTQWRIKASVGVTGDQTFYATRFLQML